MFKRVKLIIANIYFSLPIQLLANHFKRNQILLLSWLLLFAMISGRFGNYLGIPYLFLDPVYLNEVSFSSFFFVGVALAGFTIAFHISTYITDGHRATFIGTISKPFTVFSLNNSILPFLFIIAYVIFIIRYQVSNEFSASDRLLADIGGLLCGYLSMTLLLFLYFWFTNKDIFKFVVCKVDEQLKQNIKATRVSAMKKLNIARKKQLPVNHYLTFNFEAKKVTREKFYDRSTILQVFDQNHFNLVIIELLIFVVLFVIGIFRDYEAFQIPAAASFLLFLTVFVMLSGAFNYWFGSWSTSIAIILLLVVNILVKKDFFNDNYKAFGIDYDKPPVTYSLNVLDSLNSTTFKERDKSSTLRVLGHWKNKFDTTTKPKMVFICVSGGGQRSALWTLNALQTADSITDGSLMKNAMLITGASGGLLGAAYFRELKLKEQQGRHLNIYGNEHLEIISRDNLNAILFSLLMNDIFTGFQHYEYKGQKYSKDRGYTFEQQLNESTKNLLDKPLANYRRPEIKSEIPMMIMAPTIINDGRKLYISAQNVSYMTNSPDNGFKVNGIDFLRLFEDRSSADLRFLSGLRMSATFPYVTPNITLPSNPPLDVMDAGVTDNFGLTDATQFLYVFRKWISENTSGVIFVCIRDSNKEDEINAEEGHSLFEKFSMPISSFYQNFENLQDINNDSKMEYARSWFQGTIDKIDLQYIPTDTVMENISKPDSLRLSNTRRASLSWRLTSREKQSIIDNINTARNRAELEQLKGLLKQ